MFHTLFYYLWIIFSSSLTKTSTSQAHILLFCSIPFSSAPLCLCFRFTALGAVFPGELRKSLSPQHRHGLFLTCLFPGMWAPHPSALYPAPVASVGREASELKRSLKIQNQPPNLLLIEGKKKRLIKFLHLFWSMLPHQKASLVAFSFMVISDKQMRGVLFWVI